MPDYITVQIKNFINHFYHPRYLVWGSKWQKKKKNGIPLLLSHQPLSFFKLQNINIWIVMSNNYWGLNDFNSCFIIYIVYNVRFKLIIMIILSKIHQTISRYKLFLGTQKYTSVCFIEMHNLEIVLYNIYVISP